MKRLTSFTCTSAKFSVTDSPRKLEKLATKRRPSFSVLPQKVLVPTIGARVTRITVDDIGSFSAVRKTKPTGNLPPDLSEEEFKHGVQAIIGEPGEFEDWGGEKSDLFSTRLRIKSKRVAAAFAFKGPGLKGRLVIGRMGKNGDQMPRLFQEEADVFLVQHWREIDPSVLDLMRSLAVAKSVTTGREIWYGTIDGQDFRAAAASLRALSVARLHSAASTRRAPAS